MSSSHRDYIHLNAAQFNSFMRNLLAYVPKMTDKDNPVWPDTPAVRAASLFPTGCNGRG